MVPSLVSSLPFMGTKWVTRWENVENHRIFRERTPQKVVVLGASFFGERFCLEPPSQPGATQNDACMLSNVLNIEKTKFDVMKDFTFYQMTMGGTNAQVHLYFLLELLKINDGSLKYIIYDGPRKFLLNTTEREYFNLHKKLLATLDTLPQDLRTEKVISFEARLKKQIEFDERSGQAFTKRSRIAELQKLLQSKRAWFGEFLSGVKSALSKESDEAMFNHFLSRHNRLYETYDKDEYTGSILPLQKESYFEKPEDFEFLDLILDLCRKRNIQLVLYYSPSRFYYSAKEPEPYNSKIHQPTMDYLAPRGVKFLDYRDLPFLVPRDTSEGIHPSVSMKLTIARRFLIDLNRMEHEKKN